MLFIFLLCGVENGLIWGFPPNKAIFYNDVIENVKNNIVIKSVIIVCYTIE